MRRYGRELDRCVGELRLYELLFGVSACAFER
jgi:hypothetical protein